MKKLWVILAVFSLGIFLMTGCEKNSNSALSDQQLEEQAVEETLLNDENEYLVDWGIDDVNENDMFDGFSTFGPNSILPKIQSPLNNVIRFGRKINNRFRRTMVIRRISQDSIMVHMERVLAGKFVIFDSVGPGVRPEIYRKELRHRVMRNTLLVRRADGEDAQQDIRHRFRLAAVSLGEGASRPEPTVAIQQVTITGSSGDSTVFTDPLHTFLNIPDDLPTFVPGEEVRIRALVSNSAATVIPDTATGATETVLLHFGVSRLHRARKQFEYRGTDPVTGYHIYQGQWVVHEPVAHVFHAVVDVIDNGTIYDSDEQAFPYNSATWSSPYRVAESK